MANKQKSTDSINKRRIEKLLANKLSVLGLLMIVGMMFCCFGAPLFTDCDPTYIDMSLRFAAPSAEHPLGCDQSGRDLLARLLYGGRVSIAIGLVSSLGAFLLGAVIGCIAGYYGGRLDRFIVYCSEIFRCFPTTMLVLIVMGMAGQGVYIMITVFVVTGWAGAMRGVRSRVLSLKEETFVESLRATGVSGWSIMFRHILPNMMGLFIVSITANVAGYVLSEAGLSFLGVGVPKGIPTWGNMLEAARNFTTMQAHPRLWLLPGLFIAIFVVGVNFFGDGLRDVFDVTE